MQSISWNMLKLAGRWKPTFKLPFMTYDMFHINLYNGLK